MTGFTDKLVVEEDALVRVPDYLSDVQAASLPTAGVTAWHAIAELGALRALDTAVIETTGGVAIFALQIALAFGVRPIIASRSDAKLVRHVPSEHGTPSTRKRTRLGMK